MAKRHMSARGEPINFDLLLHDNKDSIALGNANMNANGDILGSGGKIIRSVDDIPKSIMADPNAAYNQINPKSTKLVSLKNKVDDLTLDTVIPVEAIEPVAEEITKTVEIKLKEKPKLKRKLIDSED